MPRYCWSPRSAFRLIGTLERTVERVEQSLRCGHYVKRYASADGLSGEEGAFLACSFWLVDALLFLDREQDARELYEGMLACANDVGLYAEEIDPQSQAFLGNFPQALTHLGLIVSAVNLELYRKQGAAAFSGTHADRARYTVEAAAGWARSGPPLSSPAGWDGSGRQRSRDCLMA